MNKFKLSSNFLVPKYLKGLIPDDLYKNKFIKNFIIVAMLRNYVSSNNKTTNENRSIIINKILITKPIDTKNLEVSFIKKVACDNYTEGYDCSVFKVIIHINNTFNPTKIGLFSNKNNFHLYQLYGDNTLHINMGLITFFKIISNDSIKLRRNNKIDEDYSLPNSNLMFIVIELIKNSLITLYKQNSSS
jgi:hypothetical protein